MIIDLAASKFGFAIIHDFENQSFVLSTICPQFLKKLVMPRS
jgi:hypothetical protein